MKPNHGASKVFFKVPGRKAAVAVEFTGRPSVLELALSQQLPLESSCGGMGTCTTCRVIVQSDLDKLPPRNEVEAEMALERDFHSNERLSCQLDAYDGLQVEIPGKKKI